LSNMLPKLNTTKIEQKPLLRAKCSGTYLAMVSQQVWLTSIIIMPIAVYPLVLIICLRLKLGLERRNFSFPRSSLSFYRPPPLLIYSVFLSFTPLLLLLLRCDCKQITNTSATARVCATTNVRVCVCVSACASEAAEWASLSLSAFLRSSDFRTLAGNSKTSTESLCRQWPTKCARQQANCSCMIINYAPRIVIITITIVGQTS